ncbi:MAG: hypothetical protein IKB37_02685 [Rikenellaceae bacterium]|nr:hypothetical protein [Rikenellaceae bacterium]
MKKIFKVFTALMAVSVMLWSCEQLDILDPNEDDTEQGAGDQEGDDQKPGDDGEGEGEGNKPGEGEGEGEGNQPGEGEGEGEGEGGGNTGDNEGGDNTGDNEGGDNIGDLPSNMTPGQHQQKLEQVALDFMEYFDAFDNKRFVDAMVAFEKCMDECENMPFEDIFGFEVDKPIIDELYPGTENQGTFTRIFDYIEDSDSYQYIVDLNMSSGDAYSYDADTKLWVKTKTDANSVKCSWDGYDAVVSWSNSSKLYELNFEYDNCEDAKYKVYVPSEIVTVFRQDGDELIRITVKPNLTDQYTIAPNFTIALYNGYTISSSSKADRVGVSSEFVMKKNGTELLSSNVAVAINDITDVDSWLIKVEEEWGDAEFGGVDEWYEIDIEQVSNNTKTGSFQINILDVAIAGTGDLRSIINEMKEVNEEEDDKVITDRLVAKLNEYATIKTYYRDSKTAICDIVAQTARSEYEDYDWETGESYTAYSYYPEPIMVFDDGTKFAFDSFFTERKFQDAIDAFWALIDDFDNLYENE